VLSLNLQRLHGLIHQYRKSNRMNTVKRLIQVSLLCSVFSMSSLFAQGVSEYVPYQGFLYESTGMPLNSTVNLTFKLYVDQVSPTPLWEETIPNVSVQNGSFSVYLGQINQGVRNYFTSGEAHYLSIAVDGSEFLQRQRLGSQPFAFLAYNSLRLDGKSADDFASYEALETVQNDLATRPTQTDLTGVRELAQDAQNAADAAQNTANGANTAAQNAQNAADAARNTADAAQNTANGANTAAQNAQNAADTAQNTADTAQNTANGANTAAQNAQNAADAAQNTANGANTAAQNAQNTANAAQTDAQNAANAAQAAQDAAQAAQVAAETGVTEEQLNQTINTLITESNETILERVDLLETTVVNQQNQIDTLSDENDTQDTTIDDLQDQIDALQTAINNLNNNNNTADVSAEILGQSNQSSSGKFTFNGQSGVRAATEMCKATFANVSTSHLCTREEITKALAQGNYPNLNTTTWIADSTNLGQTCQDLLYNSGDVAVGMTITVNTSYTSNGGGGGATGPVSSINTNQGCGTSRTVLCCR
jgi:uncharacterized coiled-coil protein SlyX